MEEENTISFYEIEEREVVALYSGLKPEIVAFDPP